MNLLILLAAATITTAAPAPKPAHTAPLQIDWKGRPRLTMLKQPVGPKHQGCCSWHGGVCGCDTQAGRAKCCDGEDSPSCGCD